jgi:hypothetical protein
MSKPSYTKAEMTAGPLGDNFIRIARHFRIIQEHTPERFAEVAKLVGISRRRAYYYAKVARVFDGVDENRLCFIGWTKLKVIADHINNSNKDQLLDLAEDCTVRELEILMRNGMPIDGTRAVLLYLEPHDYELFEKAVLSFGGKKVGRGLIDKEEALIKALSSIKS